MKILKKSILILTLLTLTLSCNKEIKDTIPEKERYSGNYVRKTLIEHFSILKCPPCTTLLKYYDNKNNESIMKHAIPVGIDMSKMRAEGINTLSKKFEFPGTPAVFVNRINPERITNPKALLGQLKKEKGTSPISIKINSQLQQTKGTVNFDVQVNADLSGLKYSVYILESGYKSGEQSGAGPEFLHNNLLRNGVIIDKPFEYKRNKGNSIEVKEIAYSILTKKIENLSVVVFITNKLGHVVQAEIAKANNIGESEISK